MEYKVYSITCLINNKKYFGRSQEIEKRWRSHKNELRRGKHSNLLLQEDWNEYGEDNFHFEVLHSFSSLKESEIKEQEYIDDKRFKKYNISNAGAGGDTFTNNPRNLETRRLKSINSTGKNNPMYGKPKSELTIKRIKEANSKPVLIRGRYYSSITEASKDLKLGSTTICYRLNAKSFKDWIYA